MTAINCKHDSNVMETQRITFKNDPNNTETRVGTIPEHFAYRAGIKHFPSTAVREAA